MYLKANVTALSNDLFRIDIQDDENRPIASIFTSQFDIDQDSFSDYNKKREKGFRLERY